MPNRILREGIVSSRAVNRLSLQAEVFYRRLMSLVDDYGRYEADIELLRSCLFGRQLDRWSLTDVGHMLAEVSGVLTDDGQPLVMVYGVGNKKYLQISNFRQRVRGNSKYPPPHDGEVRSHDGQLTVNCAPIKYSYSESYSESEAYSKAKSEAEAETACGASCAAEPTPTPLPSDRTDSEPVANRTLRNGQQSLMEQYAQFVSQYPNPQQVEFGERCWAELIVNGVITEQSIGDVFGGLQRWKNSVQWQRKRMIPAIPKWLGFSLDGKPASRRWLDRPEQCGGTGDEW